MYFLCVKRTNNILRAFRSKNIHTHISIHDIFYEFIDFSENRFLKNRLNKRGPEYIKTNTHTLQDALF